MSKTTIIILSYFITILNVIAQDSFIRHYGEFTGKGNSLIINTDGNYIIAGGRSGTFSSDQFFTYELKANGDTIWFSHYGTEQREHANQIIQTLDGGYAMVGYSAEFLDAYSSIYFLKVTNTGEVSWSKLIGGAGHENATGIVQTNSGEYYIGGSSQHNSNGLFDFLLAKTNMNGDTIWTKKYGGLLNDEVTSMRQTSDGNLILCGYTESYMQDSIDMYVVKVNPNGDTLWTKHFGGPLEEVASSIRETSDGGYIVTGNSQSFGIANDNMYVVKLNAIGDTMWTKTYGQPNRYSRGSDIIETNDGGYAITGLIKTPSSNGGFDLYVVKIDVSGNVEWEKEFKIEPSNNLYTSSYGRSILQTEDGGFAISGSWFSGSTNELLFIKLNYDGTVRYEQPENITLCNVYPNPFSESAVLKLDLDGSTNYTLNLFDLAGQAIQTTNIKSTEQIEVERGSLPSGIYFFQLRTVNEIQAIGKLVIE